MCADNHGPHGVEDWTEVPRSAKSMGAVLRNLTQPGSLHWKAQRWSANMLRRWRYRSDCCGHPGEPGC